jgi:cytochrome c556
VKILARKSGFRVARLAMVAVLLVGVALSVYGADVLKPGDMMNGKAVIAARKALMGSNSANLGDLRAKAGANNVRGIAANAQSIMVNASLIPILFEKPYRGDYAADAKILYKGADGNWDAFVSNAQELANEADALARLAREDRPVADVNAQIGKLQGVCGKCHTQFREQKQ